MYLLSLWHLYAFTHVGVTGNENYSGIQIRSAVHKNLTTEAFK